MASEISHGSGDWWDAIVIDLKLPVIRRSTLFALSSKNSISINVVLINNEINQLTFKSAFKHLNPLFPFKSSPFSNKS
jgi:hypothetical protein